jgi:DNA-binding MarR family transcriptional regulator
LDISQSDVGDPGGREIGSATTETAITLGVLAAVERDSTVTQRSIADELGIALGLTNAYLKRCVKKGWIKIHDAPRNRYLYYLTARGFAEKSRLTAEYLSQSFKFFRAARNQCSGLLVMCRERGWRRVALAGRSDLAEIAMICAQTERVALEAIVDEVGSREGAQFSGLPVVTWDDAARFDAVLVTELKTPQRAYDELARRIPAERILHPQFLRIASARTPLSTTQGRRPA